MEIKYNKGDILQSIMTSAYFVIVQIDKNSTQLKVEAISKAAYLKSGEIVELGNRGLISKVKIKRIQKANGTRTGPSILTTMIL